MGVSKILEHSKNMQKQALNKHNKRHKHLATKSLLCFELKTPRIWQDVWFIVLLRKAVIAVSPHSYVETLCAVMVSLSALSGSHADTGDRDQIHRSFRGPDRCPTAALGFQECGYFLPI